MDIPTHDGWRGLGVQPHDTPAPRMEGLFTGHPAQQLRMLASPYRTHVRWRRREGATALSQAPADRTNDT